MEGRNDANKEGLARVVLVLCAAFCESMLCAVLMFCVAVFCVVALCVDSSVAWLMPNLLPMRAKMPLWLGAGLLTYLPNASQKKPKQSKSAPKIIDSAIRTCGVRRAFSMEYRIRKNAAKIKKMPAIKTMPFCVKIRSNERADLARELESASRALS